MHKLLYAVYLISTRPTMAVLGVKFLMMMKMTMKVREVVGPMLKRLVVISEKKR
jgi:hypothetical protein